MQILQALIRATALPLLFALFSSFLLPDIAESSEGKLRSVTLQLANQHSFRYGGYYAALKHGFFEKSGLQVTILPGSSGTSSSDAVLRGDAEYGICGGELVYHRLMGKPVVAVAPIFQHSPWAFVRLPLSPIQSPHNLLDQTLLVSVNTYTIEHLATLKYENIPLNRVNLLFGDIDDYLGRKNTMIFTDVLLDLYHLNSHGQRYTLISPRAYGVDFYGDTLMTSKQEADNHYGDVIAFREASIQGWEYALDNPHEIIHFIISNYNPSFSHDFFTFESEILRKLIAKETGTIGHNNPGRWKRMADTYKLLEKVPQNQNLDGFLLSSPRKTLSISGKQILLLIAFFILALGFVLLFTRNSLRNRKTQKLRSHAFLDSTLADTLENINDIAIIGMTGEGEIFFWNTGATELLGYGKQEVVGGYFENLVISDLQGQGAAGSILQSEEFFLGNTLNEFVLNHKSGARVKVCGSLIRHAASPHVEEIYGVFFNTAAFTLFEDKKKASDERYHFLFETMLEGFALYEMIFDNHKNPVNYRFVTVNPAFEKITGRRAQDVIGRTIQEVLPQFDPKWLKLYGDVATTGKPARFIDHTVEKDRFFEIAAFRPQAGYFACFFNDISDFKMAEKKIAYQASILNNVRNGIVVTTSRGIIKYLNQYAEKLFQYRAEEIIGELFSTLLPPQHITTDTSVRNLKLQKQGYWQGEATHIRKDGTQFAAHVSEQLIKDDYGKVIAHLNIIEDISDRKDLLNLVQEYQNITTVSSLAKSITHAFNNSLAAILGYTEIALEDIPEKTPGRENLTKIFETGWQAKNLVSQIMLFDSGHASEHVSLNVTKIVDDALALLKISWPPHIQLVKNIDYQCGTILGHPLQIYQLMLSLCSSIMTKMEKNGGIITIFMGDSDRDHLPPGADSKYVSLTVSAEFSFHDQRTQEENGKEHFDLKHAQAVTSEHNGLFTYSSTGPGVHHFQFNFPEVSRKITEKPEETLPVETGSESILVIDDEQRIVEITGRILEGLGYRVTIASDSKEALEVFKDNPHGFDLVITDQTMPNITGSELTDFFFKIRPDIPVIICTGYVHLVDNELADELGIQGLLIKPVTKRELAQKIRSVLDKR